MEVTYVREGRSLYLALIMMGCVKIVSVSEVVPMVKALAKVAIAATPLKMRSAIEIPLLIPRFGAAMIVDASPDSTASAFMIDLRVFPL